ncbi:hypothetical protein [Ornithinimicrobium cryptoxanthini]|uniref:Winged helix DNA-binding domain-containing protein n=1 Tax=Ornithinimicrobium cryptoxanthini TaxID=2934161 RepID=A0ABY4YMU3_9MICO|nr:hypothetical protein [Ornithinimicrobium cryptoxanthini]USQ77805.1 hypothetical protein NF557_07900 [Ornithinimicrobium cryptoxanthini]
MSARSQRLDAHTGRVLILLRHFGATGETPLEGLTKLAKLDFLIRYPVFTDRLLEDLGADWMLGTQPTDDERQAVESRMVRYKYGPWDDRYYPVLGTLVGLGLVTLGKKGRTLVMSLTEAGADLAANIAGQEDWQQVDLRASFLRTHFNVTGSRLKRLIYTKLPDVVDRPIRTVI